MTTTTTSPSIAAFMAQPAEEFLDETTDLGPVEAALKSGDPLASIAESLQQLVRLQEAGTPMFTAELTADAAPSESLERLLAENHGLRERVDDLEAHRQVLVTLVDDIEEAVGKSTAKPSLAVKALIDAWKAPEVPSDHITKAEREQMMSDGDEPEGEVLQNRPDQPAHDAPVEEWRAYCRELRPAEFLPVTLDTMNRSQIRTFLGLEQPVSA